ncbi:MAG TPA: ATP-binding protein [Actinomycetota bacterium]
MHVRDARPAPADLAAAVESLMLVERTKWAMRIHDGLTQSVTSAVLELQALRHQIADDPLQAIAAIAEIESQIRRDLSDIRSILFELDEVIPDPAQPLAQFVDDVVQRWKLPARVVVEGDVDHVPAVVQEVAHRIISEALANAAKHSGAPEVSLRLRATPGELRIEVEDRGAGIGSDEPDADPHFGIHLMQARVAELGGTLDIESTPGSGTRLVACLPVGE